MGAVISAQGMRLAALVFAVAVALGLAANAAGADSAWTERDFRLRTTEAYLGDPAESFVEFNGTVTRQARTAGLYPHFRFTADLTLTCEDRVDPAQTFTRQLSLDSRHDHQLVLGSATQYSHLEAGTIKWSTRFTFTIPTGEAWDYALCQGLDYVVSDAVLTHVSGISWLSTTNFAPVPGSTLYRYEIPAGESVLRFAKDGVAR